MTDLVPPDQIEAIVGARRHETHHYARCVSAEEAVYVLHSAQCLREHANLRACPFSVALDRGIDLEAWTERLDQPVRVDIWADGQLGPVSDATGSASAQPTTPTNVYLDVDGVLNAVTHSRPQWGWSDDNVERERVNGFPITYSPELIARINALAARDDVAVHWLTTWNHDAPRLLAPAIGLVNADWPVVGVAEYDSVAARAEWWKLTAIRAHLPEGRRAVWIDDDIAWDRDALLWLAMTPTVRGIAPRTYDGLTADQMVEVEAWCDDRSTP